jgi:translation initiation factor 1
MTDSRLVYSTESGQICPGCQKPAANCNCKKRKPKPSPKTKQDGIIRIRREVKGRRGKTASVIYGFQFDQVDLPSLAKQLKQQCGTGGSVKDDVIIIQGDHRKKLMKLLKALGYKVKLSGG